MELWDAGIQNADGYKLYKDYILRTPKMNVTDSQGKKIFRGRDTHALRFPMFKDEATFYKEVSKYISAGYRMVEHLKDRNRRLAIGFVRNSVPKISI